MKRFASCIIALVMANSLAGQSRFERGVLHVKVSPEMAQEFERKPFGFSRTGRVTTGIGKLDMVNEKLGTRAFTRIFAPAGRFEEAHRAYGLHLWYAVTFDSLHPLDQATHEYQRTGYFEKVETVRPYVHITSQPADPDDGEVGGSKGPDPLTTTNDPFFSLQWHYKNTGQSGGTSGADIALEQGWSIEQGKSNVIVAIIDGGIDIRHPDLAGALWVNSDEIPGNGRDDDANGYVDDVHGYGFGDNTGTIYPNFHGTHVAGTIGAITNNGVGVSGIAGGSGTANGVRLMSCAGFGEFGIGGFENAMVYAADNGAVISQNSWGGGSSAIEAAIDYFVARAGLDNSAANFSRRIQTGPMAGGIVIFAAGNSNSENPTAGYPGSYRSVFAVASTDHNDVRSVFSNYGTWVELAAPGSNVYSTYPLSLGGYEYLSGTSMACPHVSGVAALIISKFGGTGYLPTQVWDRLVFTADNIDAKNTAFIGKLGGGRLNSNQALESNDGVPPAAIIDLTATDVRFQNITLAWTASGSSGNTGAASYYDLRISNSPITEANFNASNRISPLPRPAAAGTRDEFTVTGLLTNTTYYFAIKAGDFFGNQSAISNVISITTPPPPIIRVTPVSLSETLLTGAQKTRELLVENLGGSPLDFKVFVGPGPTSVSQSMSRVSQSDLPTSKFEYVKGLQVHRTPELTTNQSPVRQSSRNGRIFSLYGVSTLAELDPATGGIIAQLTLPESASGGPDGLAFDGVFLYFINSFGTGRIHQINAATGAVVASKVIPGLSSIDGLAHNGVNLFALDYDRNEIIEIDYTLGELTRRINPGIDLGGGISFGGSRGTVFVSNFESRIYELDLATGSIVNQFPPTGTILGLGYSEAEKLLFAQNISANRIDAHDPSTGRVVRSISAFYSGALASDEGGAIWLTPSITQGTVSPGGSVTVPIEFNAAGLLGGLYRKTIIINSDDPATTKVDVPVSLTVIGAPNLLPSESSLDFGEVYVGLSKTLNVTLGNNGTDVLNLDSIRFENTDFFSNGVFPAELQPGQTQTLTVTFRPSGLGNKTGGVAIFSNDPDLARLNIPLVGKGVDPPIISVIPDSLGVTLFSNDTTSRQLIVYNSGGSQLTYEILISENSPSSTPANTQTQPVPAATAINNNGAVVRHENTTPVQWLEGVFTMKASSSQPLTCVAVDPRQNVIFAQGNQSNLFYKYSPKTDAWEQMANCPIFSGNNGGAAYLNGRIYTTYTGSNESGVYDIATNQWTTFSKPFLTGNITTDGTHLFFAIGFDLHRYNPVSGSWDIFRNCPTDISPWGGAVFHKGEVFVHSGNANTGFAKFTLATNSWTLLPNVPGGTVLGATIDPILGVYYTYGSYAGNNLYAFDLDKNTWSFTGIPDFMVNDGGLCFIRGSSFGGLYMIEGESGYRLAHFKNRSSKKWISVGVTEGVVQPGQNNVIQVAFDATGLFGGDYKARLELVNNDPVRENLTVPVNLRVIGVPDITTSPDSLTFGNVFVTDFKSLPLTITNVGTDQLSIRSISLNNPEFSLTGESTFDLAPGEERQVAVKLSPASTGTKSGELLIQSNDPNEPVLVVQLRGTASRPPIASLSPQSIELAGESGSTITDHVRLNNSGPSTLEFNSYISYQEHGNHPAVDTFFLATNTPARISTLVTDVATGLIFGQEGWSGSFFEFNPATGAWTSKAPSPIPISTQAKAISISGKIFVGSTNRSDLSVYTIATNSWSTIAGVHNATALTTDGRYIYSAYYQDLRRFDPQNNSWTTLSVPPFVVVNGGLEFFDGNLYCHGGWSNNEFARYSIATNSWTVLPSLTMSAGSSSAFDFHSKSYIALANDFNNTLLSFSLTTQSWTYTTIPLFAPAGSGLTYYPYGLQMGVYFTEGYAGNRLACFQRSIDYWLSVNPVFGSVAANHQLEMSLSANAQGLTAGRYTATIHVNTNDPNNRTLLLPVGLNIVGKPDISVSVNSLDFGTVFSDQTRQRELIVYNLGTDTLRLTDLRTTQNVFSIPNVATWLLPGEARNLSISLLSTTAGTFQGQLRIMSNDSDEGSLSIDLFASVVIPPKLQVSPPSISMSMLPNNIRSTSITIANSGASPLNWGGSVGQGSGSNQLERTKSSLDLRSLQITSAIPNRFDFLEGETGESIVDGGNDMFDGGNMISVNQTGVNLPYTNGNIVSTNLLGTGGRYFTRKYPGLFVLAADLNNVSTFTINGNLGADGNGVVDQSVISLSVNGIAYSGFIKRVFSAGDPSVNQLIIVRSSPTTNHQISSNSDQNFHEVIGLGETSRLYYLLFASINGGYVDNNAMTSIMTHFLDAVSTGVDWLHFSSISSGTVNPGSAYQANLTVNTTGLTFGQHTTSVVVRSNDPTQPEFAIPVELLVIDNSRPHLVTPIAQQAVAVNGTISVNLAAHIKDPDNQALLFEAIAHQGELCELEVIGSVLTITGRLVGDTRVVVTAIDPAQARTETAFDLRVSEVITSLPEAPVEGWVLAPNPANDFTSIHFSADHETTLSASIVDQTGRETRLLENQFCASGYHIIPIPVNHLASGSYIIRLVTNEAVVNKHLVVIR